MEIFSGTAICGCCICLGNLFSLAVDVLSNQNDFLLIGQFYWLFSFDKGEFLTLSLVILKPMRLRFEIVFAFFEISSCAHSLSVSNTTCASALILMGLYFCMLTVGLCFWGLGSVRLNLEFSTLDVGFFVHLVWICVYGYIGASCLLPLRIHFCLFLELLDQGNLKPDWTKGDRHLLTVQHVAYILTNNQGNYLSALHAYIAFLVLISRGSLLVCDLKLVPPTVLYLHTSDNTKSWDLFKI